MIIHHLHHVLLVSLRTTQQTNKLNASGKERKRGGTEIGLKLRLPRWKRRRRRRRRFNPKYRY